MNRGRKIVNECYDTQSPRELSHTLWPGEDRRKLLMQIRKNAISLLKRASSSGCKSS